MSKMRLVLALGVLLVVFGLPSTASAQLAFCMANSAFSDRYDLVAVPGATGAGSQLLVGSERTNARTVDGSIRIGVGNGAVIQWRKNFPNGTNFYFCDVNGTTGSGPGSLTRIISGNADHRTMQCMLCPASPEIAGADQSEEP